MIETNHESKTRLLNAALHVIRAKGYSATRIEDVCEAADLTKGSFFHHFKSKDDLGLAAAEHWRNMTQGVFESATYRSLSDPLDRLLGYVDYRKAILKGDLPEFTCLAGTMIQEVYRTHPVIRQACDRSISEHAAAVEADIAEAMQKHRIEADWSAESLSLYMHAVIQGAFIMAKAKDGPEVALTCIDHLRRHIEMIFSKPKQPAGKTH